MAPETLSDLTVFGDWGGYSAVDAVNDGMGNYNPQTPGQAMAITSIPCGAGCSTTCSATSGGGACGVGIACGFNMADAGTPRTSSPHRVSTTTARPGRTSRTASELPSLMNYAYIDSGYRLFSDGRAAAAQQPLVPETAAVDPSETTASTR